MNADKSLFAKQLPENFALNDNCFYRILCFSLKDSEAVPAGSGDLPQNYLDNICMEQFPERADLCAHHLNPNTTILYVEYRDGMDQDILKKKCQSILNSVRRYLQHKVFSFFKEHTFRIQKL